MVLAFVAFLFASLLIAVVMGGAVKDDQYQEAVERRFLRDEQLRRVEAAFIREYGREPTANELWACSPPDEL